MKKRIGLFILALSFLATNAFAQGGNGERYKQMLKDSLQLSDVQIDSVMQVQQAFQPQMRDIFMDQSMGVDDKKTKMADINMQMRPRLKAFLSEEQVNKLEAIQQKMRERMRDLGGTSDNK